MNLLKIKSISEKKRITLISIANAIDMSVQNLHLCIRKNKIDAESLHKISNLLDVPISIFFEDVILPNNSNSQVHNGIGDNNIILSQQEKEIEYLKETIKRQDQIISEKERTIQLLIQQK